MVSSGDVPVNAAPQQYVTREPGMPLLLRVLWFFLVGWHVALAWILIAWFLNVTIIGLPAGLWMLNRVPLVLTLRMPRGYTVTEVGPDGTLRSRYRAAPQISWLFRFLYFVLVGWWFSLMWSLIAWLLCVSIIGLPFGILMLNRLPNVTTLMRQ